MAEIGAEGTVMETELRPMAKRTERRTRCKAREAAATMGEKKRSGKKS